MSENRDQRTDVRRQMSEDKYQRTDVRRQMSEDRCQKAENSGQGADASPAAGLKSGQFNRIKNLTA